MSMPRYDVIMAILFNIRKHVMQLYRERLIKNLSLLVFHGEVTVAAGWCLSAVLLRLWLRLWVPIVANLIGALAVGCVHCIVNVKQCLFQNFFLVC